MVPEPSRTQSSRSRHTRARISPIRSQRGGGGRCLKRGAAYGANGESPTGAVPILALVEKRATGRRLAWSTAIFSLATRLSRILRLVRELVAAYYLRAAGHI